MVKQYPLVIGFGYRARHGKDTAVATLIERYQTVYNIRSYSFAGTLKAEVYDKLLKPMDPAWYSAPFNYLKLPHPTGEVTERAAKVQWINDHKEDLGRVLQWYGTEYVRAKDPFHWVRSVRSQIVEEMPQVALISDVRFKNEFLWVKSLPGFMVKVVRLNEDGSLWLDPTRDPNHPSEVDLDGVRFDFEITCKSGAVDELRQDALTVFDMIRRTLQPVIPDLPVLQEQAS